MCGVIGTVRGRGMAGERRTVAAMVAVRVRQLRLRRALTIPELAMAAGVLPHHVARLERGQHLPTLLFLERIAAAMDVALPELLTPAERELSLLERLRSSPAECAKLLAVQERAMATPTEDPS